MKQQKLYDVFVDYLEVKKTARRNPNRTPRGAQDVDYDSDKGAGILQIKGKRADFYKKTFAPHKDEPILALAREACGYAILKVLKGVSKYLNIPKHFSIEIKPHWGRGFEDLVDPDENPRYWADHVEYRTLFTFAIISSGSPFGITIDDLYQELTQDELEVKDEVETKLKDIEDVIKTETEKQDTLPFHKEYIAQLQELKKDFKEAIKVTNLETIRLAVIHYIIPNVLIGNSDTHFGNFITSRKSGQMYQIDPGRAFGGIKEAKESGEWGTNNSTFNKILTNLLSDFPDTFKEDRKNLRYKKFPERTKKSHKFEGSEDTDPAYAGTFTKLKETWRALRLDDLVDKVYNRVLREVIFWQDKLTGGLEQKIYASIEKQKANMLKQIQTSSLEMKKRLEKKNKEIPNYNLKARLQILNTSKMEAIDRTKDVFKLLKKWAKYQFEHTQTTVNTLSWYKEK